MGPQPVQPRPRDPGLCLALLRAAVKYKPCAW